MVLPVLTALPDCRNRFKPAIFIVGMIKNGAWDIIVIFAGSSIIVFPRSAFHLTLVQRFLYWFMTVILDAFTSANAINPI